MSSDIKIVDNGTHRYCVLNRHFLEHPSLVANLTTSFDEVYSRIFQIEALSKMSSVCFDQLEHLCYELVCRIPIPIIEIDTFLVRCRPDFERNGKVFSNVGELSYNPNRAAVYQGRFNRCREPLFYACVPSDAPGSSTALGAILESCKEVLNPVQHVSHRYATVSRWDVQQGFWVMNVSMYDQAAAKNLSVKRINSYYIRKLMNCFTPKSVQTMLLLYRYLSQKAGSIQKEDSDYWITTAFKHAVSAYYGRAIAGTLYSSAMSENHCLNVALDRQLVDDGILKMHGAIVYKITNHSYLPERGIYPCSHYAKVDIYGNFALKLFSKEQIFN